MRKTSQRSDEVLLWARVKKGDLASFEDVMALYESRIFNFARRFVGNSEDARDVLQETFLRAYRHRDQWNGKRARLSTWLFTIASNLCRDHLRRSRKRWQEVRLDSNPRENHPTMELIPDITQSPRHEAERSEICKLLEQAVGELPEQLREILLLSECEGMTYKEISDILQCSVGTVKSRAFRARKELQQALEDLNPKTEVLRKIDVKEVM